jgi:hypothetical protein
LDKISLTQSLDAPIKMLHIGMPVFSLEGPRMQFRAVRKISQNGDAGGIVVRLI